MEPSSNVDHTLSGRGAKPVVGAEMQGVLHPQLGGDGEHSLAEMAQRDLDAALQLLADRAQYITGASGAAIAIRRDGKKDMLCRASTGPNAPELGALLSTEFGLSGESVRTRQPLRCDDAERDLRVNREVCRQMGIASVVVMPVVNDDEVLGVFELFSGKANAFGARDLSAVQRLSEMVETALRLAQATERLPERLKMADSLGSEMSQAAAGEVQASDHQAPDRPAAEAQALDAHPEGGGIVAGQLLADMVLEDPLLEDAVLEVATDSGATPRLEASVAERPTNQEIPVVAAEGVKAEATLPSLQPEKDAGTTAAVVQTTPVGVVKIPAAENAPPKKNLFWSAAMNPAADAGTAVEPDQSHVPPMLRSLRKCEACGFPVSAGRALCVECEEKKWRGQLRVPRVGSARPTTTLAEKILPAVKPEARAFAAAAQATAAAGSGASAVGATVAVRASSAAVTAAPARKDDRTVTAATTANADEREIKAVPAAPASSTTSSASAQSSSAPSSSELAVPNFVFSAGLAPSQSWLATHKYILGVLLVVGGAVAAYFLLR